MPERYIYCFNCGCEIAIEDDLFNIDYDIDCYCGAVLNQETYSYYSSIFGKGDKI